MGNYWFDIVHYWDTTRHLSNEEDLAYRRLLYMYYDNEKPISCDILRVSAGISIHPFVVEKILNEFFILKDDGWHRSPEDQARERVKLLREEAEMA